ncbi:MAG: hypothetical protein ACRD5Z_13345, partial [Bryobacteraceae bacterium]
MIDRQMALELGAYSDKNTEGSADWDLFIRFLAAGRAAVHIPEVVYGWRMHAESTADDALSKPYIHTSQRAVLERYLNLRGIAEDYRVEYSPLLNGTADWWIERRHTRPWPALLVILTNRPAGGELVNPPNYPDLPCVKLPALAGLSHLKEVLCNRPATPARGLGDFQTVLTEHRLAAGLGSEELVCLVSEDLQIDRQDWLWDAISLLEKHPDAVMVGGRIRNSRDEIVSAGLVLGFEGGAGCPDAGRAAIDPGYFTQMFKQRSVSAVSSQFAVIRSSFLRELPADVSIPFLGAWAGARARRLGRRIIFSPFLSAVSDIDWQALV